MAGRQIFMGESDQFRNEEERFATNKITTARYNVFTFFPIQLFEQFKKAANLYFLFIGLLQQIPNLSPTGQFTTIGPLIIFVFLSMMREAYDDLKRHRQDRKENNKTVEVFEKGVCVLLFFSFLFSLFSFFFFSSFLLFSSFFFSFIFFVHDLFIGTQGMEAEDVVRD